MKRRNFIKASGLVSSASMLPNFLAGMAGNYSNLSRSGKILVVIQLSGGNDGLNTIVPHGDDLYYNLRPTLSIPNNEVIKLNNHLGLHPSLAPLQSLYDEGLMTIINNVGYPNPDRSHFRSMDIWQTASASDEYLSSGWIGRYLDNHCDGLPSYTALEVDDGLSLALKGKNRNGFAITNPKRMKNVAGNKFLRAAANSHDHDEDNVAYLYKTLIDTQSSADYLFEKAKLHTSTISYPMNPLGRDLKQISELITADTATKVYYAGMSGFDTHANQKGTQQRLLKQYADSMSAFVTDLQQNNLLDDVLIMTFSEFGRRAKQNGSNGTDHGTANNVFMIGGGLQKPGFYNDGPNLGGLINEDLVYDIDFRRIYANVLDQWLEGDSKGILSGQFQGLGLV